MSLISVIIPAYNVGIYIQQAINCIINQTFKNWELIIVNDGSTDNTFDVCKQFALSNPDIHIINIENGGMSAARNAALEIANGDYIVFMDADDLIHPQLLETLFSYAQSCNADICSVKFKKFHQTDNILHSINSKLDISKLSITPYKPLEAIEDALYQKHLNNSVWGKIYKSSLFKNLRFQPGIGYEDLDIFYKIWIKANKIIDISAPLYYYRQHPKSYLHKFNIKRTDVLKVTADIVDWCDENYKILLPAARDREFSANCNMLLLLHKYKYARKASEILASCRSIIKKYRKEELTNSKVRLKNKIGAILSYPFIF